MYLYNASYPEDYDKVPVDFEKFEYELDTSDKKQGLPGLCNLYLYPVVPCKIPNVSVPIRKCSEIGEGKFSEWPRVQYYWWGFEYYTTLENMLQMLGSSFISCNTEDVSGTRLEKKPQTPIVPNMKIVDGYDGISNTACLKLNFNGVVEPIWLGNTKVGEKADVYLERLPIYF